MNNLKRVLSLGMAGTMLAGMMTAGAANVADFTDAAEISNTDAVATMAALGVIKGTDTGAFNPQGNVTRAEMAKMLCVALNGGKDPVLGTNSKPTFSDTKGHWAEKYIEYCYSKGYVAGRGNGIFDPDATVTSTEAAKMILTALGYKADLSGFVGTDWAINTNAQANAADSDLYDSLETIDTTAPMSRENAAQMLYNALSAKLVTVDAANNYQTSTYSGTVTVKEQTGVERLYEMTGIDASLTGLTGSKFDSVADAQAMADATKGSTATLGSDFTLTQVEEPTYSISNAAQDFDETFGHKYMDLTIYSSSANAAGYVESVNEDSKGTYTVTLDNGMTFTKVADDYSYLMGQKVKVLYKAMNDVYGIYAHVDSEVLFEGVINDITVAATGLKLDGSLTKTELATPGNTPIYNFNDFTTSTTASAKADLDKAAAIKVIDNDADGKIDLIVATPFVVNKVTYKGTDTLTLGTAVSGNTSFDLDDIEVYEGIAKGDFVIATPDTNTVSGKVVLEKAETVAGKVAAMKGTDAKIDGTWYSAATTAYTGSDTVALNDNVELVLVNGFYAYADTTYETTKDLLVVTKLGTADISGNYEAKIALTDGSTLVAKVYDDSTINVGSFYTYEINDNGVYELTAATTTNTGYDGTISSTNFDESENTLADKTRIADDAVVIVLHKKAANNTSYTSVTDLDDLTKVDIITGKTLKGWSKDYGDSSKTAGFYTKLNGLKYAKVLFLAADADELVTGSDTQYGYIVSDPYKEKSGSNYYITFDLWNGSEVVTVQDKVASTQEVVAPYVKGTIVSYADEGDGIVDSVTAISTSGAILGHNANDKTIEIVGTSSSLISATELTSDTKYFWINTEKMEGVQSEGIELATETATADKYYANVYYVANGDGEIVALFIDVNNKIVSGGSDVYADCNVNLTGMDTATSTSNWGFAYADAEGNTLTNATEAFVLGDTITVTATASASATKGFVVKVGTNVVASVGNGSWSSGDTETVTFTVTAGGAVSVEENN